MKDNRGYTLIELIIVIAIVSILGGGSAIGFNMLNSRGAKNAADRILSLMDYVKVENLTKNKIYYLDITTDSEAKKYMVRVLSTTLGRATTVESAELLDLRGGEITFEDSTGGTNYLISPVPVTGRVVTDHLLLSYRKDTGSLQEYKTGITVTRIGITSAGRTSYIRLVAITGKHYIE